MRTKRLLIALPLLILAVFAQSAFWVPSYATQAQTNPARLGTFLRASIGDAKLLNPIFATDQSTIEVLLNNVTEALVDSDENGKLIPRLADHWEVTEEAYLAVLPHRKLLDGSEVSALSLLAALRSAWKDAQLGGLEASIQGLDIVPPELRKLSATALVDNAKGRKEPVDVALSVDVPERIRFRLSKVEPELFKRLESVVGASYFANYSFAERFHFEKPEQASLVRDRLPELLAVGEHNPVITFYLRPGVRWHDGAAFTAEDVKFTYEALVDPKNASPHAANYEAINAVRVVNDLTVRMTYKRLYSPAIIDWCIEIIPKHLLDGAALEREMNARGITGDARKTFSLRTSNFNRSPVGTGPFRFAEWRPDQFIRLTRNDDYWGRKAELREVYFRVIPDYLTMELELQAGALDRYQALPHQAARYRRDPDYQVVSNPQGYYAYIGYNMRRPLFQDVRVRRALGMAIDVDSIIKYVLYGEGKRATGPYYSTTPFNDPSVKPLPYDPAAALALLAAAGWHKNAHGTLEKDGKPFQFTLVTNNANPQRKAIMTVAQEAWRKLGIDCKIQAFEWTVFIGDFVEQDNFDAIVLAWGGGDTNPDKYELWHSSQTHPFERNYAGYQSPEADDLITRIRLEYDPAAQIELAHELHRVIAEDQPYTFLYEPLQPIVYDKRIVRVRKAPDGTETFEKLRAPRVGTADQAMSEWRKLSPVPELAAQ